MNISTSALIKCIKNRLPDYQHLRTVRGERASLDLGGYFIQDINRNLALAIHFDPEVIAREAGILR